MPFNTAFTRCQGISIHQLIILFRTTLSNIDLNSNKKNGYTAPRSIKRFPALLHLPHLLIDEINFFYINNLCLGEKADAKSKCQARNDTGL